MNVDTSPSNPPVPGTNQPGTPSSDRVARGDEPIRPGAGQSPKPPPRGLLTRVRTWWIATSLGLAWIAFDQYYLPRSLSYTAHEWAQGLGIELTTGDWAIDWMNQTISASGVTVGTPGEPDPVIRIRTVSLDFALLRLIDGWRAAIYQLRVDSPEIRAHKRLGGDWNVFGLFDSSHLAALVAEPSPGGMNGFQLQPVTTSGAATADNGATTPNGVRLDWIIVDGGTIEMREELRGRSDGTTTELRFADIRIDDLSLRARDVVWPASSGETIQTWQMQGRIGTGQVSLTSAGNLLTWRPPRQDETEWGQAQLVWNPRLQGTLTLQRFAAETLSRLLPDARFVATRGEVSGPVNFELFDRSFLRLDAPELVLEGVEYVDVTNQSAYAAATTASARFEGNLAEPGFRPAALTAASLAESGLREQPDDVRVEAVRQTRSVDAGLTDRSREDMETRRPPEVQALLSEVAGSAIQQSLQDELGAGGAAAAGALTEQVLNQEGQAEGAQQPGLIRRMGTRIGDTTRNVWRKITGKDD